jgi:hypothetical protein
MREAVRRRARRELTQTCDLLRPAGDGQGGQTLTPDASDVPCRLFEASAAPDRESKRQVERGSHVLHFALSADVRGEHVVELVDDRGATRRFEVAGMQGRTADGAFLRVAAIEITE